MLTCHPWTGTDGARPSSSFWRALCPPRHKPSAAQTTGDGTLRPEAQVRLACPRPLLAPRPPSSQHFPPEHVTTMLVPRELHANFVDTPISDGRQEIQERIKVSCTLVDVLLAKPRQGKSKCMFS